jgi:sporulation protein YlmC with PRC-barrel domain
MMPKQEIKLELLVGRRVFAQNGRSIGRLEEIAGELRQGRCFVTEFHVGSYAMFERLSAGMMGRAIIRSLGPFRPRGGYRVPWDKLDLSDPKRPRLLCKVSELIRLNDQH